MSFANPIMLAAVAAVAVPILIHLLNRRKYHRVKWAAMRFVKAATDQDRRRIRIEDLLLMLIRCAMLVALAIAAARPLWKRFANLVPTGGVTAVILIDNSSGMTGTDGVTTRFKSAQAAADAVVAALPTGSSAAVILASARPDLLVPEPTRDLTFVRRAVSQATVSDSPPSMQSAVQKAIAVLAKATGTKELIIVTDGRAGGWAPMDTITRSIADAHDDVSTQVLLVGPAVTSNVGIDSVVAGGDLVQAGHAMRFDVAVSNYGTSEVKQLPVQLRIDDEPKAESETVVDSLPPGVTRIVALFGTLPTPGTHWVTASVPDRTDAMPADNKRTIAVRGIDTVHVLLIDGTSHHDGSPGGGDFVHAALVPVSTERAKKYFVQVSTVRPADFNVAALEKTDIVAVVDTNLSPQITARLGRFVSDGGGLFYFPGASTDVAGVNADLVDRLHLLPLRYGDGVGDPANQDAPLSFQIKPFNHPISSIWNGETAGDFQAAHVYRHLPMISADPKDSDAEVVLSYADKTPAVVARQVGQGMVIQFGTSADTSWTDLPLRANFVPLLYRSMAAVAAVRDKNLNVPVGQPFTKLVSVDQAAKPVAVTDPANVQSATTVGLNGESARLTIRNTDRAGGYRFTVAASSEVEKFAAKSDPTGSRLEMLTADQNTALSAVADVRRWDEHSTERSAGSGRSAGELWFPLVIAALLLTIVEPLAANWMSRSK